MIPFLDLPAQYRVIKSEIDVAVMRVIESSQFVLGDEVAAFERTFATYCGADAAIAVNSGTSALHLALLAYGIGPGDEVITVSMTFAATVAAVLYAGATPILVDVDPEHWTIDPSAVERAITPRTKAILPVHLHGRMANMTAIMDIARRRGLTVIEDAAQAHGAECGGRRAGSIGHIGCFSFYPGKIWAPMARAVRSSLAIRRRRKRFGACATGVRAGSTTTSSKGLTTGWTRSRRRFSTSRCGTSRSGPKRAARMQHDTTSCSPPWHPDSAGGPPRSTCLSRVCSADPRPRRGAEEAGSRRNRYRDPLSGAGAPATCIFRSGI